MNIPNYVSPENRKEIDELMKERREAQTSEEKAVARENINKQVTEDAKSAWCHLAKEEKD